MKLSLPLSELKAALTGLLKLIPRKVTIQVLKCLRLSTKDGVVRLSATDLECWATYTCPTAFGIEPGPDVVVDAQRLKDALGLAHTGEIDLAVVASGRLRVTVRGERGSVETVLALAEPDEYPPVPEVPGLQPAAPLLLTRMQDAECCVSSDPSRYILNGVCIEAWENGHRVIGTDGRRLSAYPVPRLPLPDSLIVPVTKFLLCLKAEERLEVGVIHPSEENNGSPRWFALRTGPWTYVGKVIDGAFPRWSQVVPGGPPPERMSLAEADVDLLAEALHVLPGVEAAKGERCVRVRPGPAGVLRLSGYDPETQEWAHRDLSASRMTGDARGITLNRAYLLQAVKAGFREFRWSDDLSPMVAEMHDDHGALLGKHVLMPMRSEAPPAPMPNPEPQAETTPEPATTTVAAEPASPPETPNQPETPPVIHPDPVPASNGASSAGSTPPADPLLAAFTAVKGQIQALGNALSELGGQLKALRKQDKARQAELDNARELLARLQTVKI